MTTISSEKLAVLFICMGNICRSPTAEGIFRSRVDKAGLSNVIHIDSAGTHAYHIGKSPDKRSQECAKRRGYDLSRQRARKVEAEDFSTFDYLLAMDHDNLGLLKTACPPQHRHKLGLLMQFATRSRSDVVPDPYYGNGAGFDLVVDYIEDASDGLLAALRQRLEAGDRAA